MINLHTPREVLNTAIVAAQRKAQNAPAEGVGHLQAIRARLHERGMLDIAMAASSVEALFDEVSDEIARKEEAERRHVESFESHKPL